MEHVFGSWMALLPSPLDDGERIARQRNDMRIARLHFRCLPPDDPVLAVHVGPGGATELAATDPRHEGEAEEILEVVGE